MPHRILHIASSLDRYSPARDLLALLGALPSDEFEQHEVVLGHSGALAGDFAKAARAPRYLEQRWTYDPTTLVRLACHLRSTGPALVHAWDLPSREYAKLALPWAGHRPLIAHCDDVEPGRPQWPVPNRWRHRADRLVVRSDAVRDQLEQRCNNMARYVVVEPGVAPAVESSTTREQFLQEFHLPGDARLLAVAGPLTPSYGVKELIWAADMVRVLHPNMRLLIVGDGPQRDHLERFAHTAAVPENICFLGDTDRWPDIARHLDVYWQGTELGAVSPTTILEAMAAGVPVVASDTPQHREIIDDAKTGYLVGIADRAAWTRVTDLLLNQTQQARTIGSAGRNRVLQHHSLAARAEKFAALYHELLPMYHDSPSR